MKPSLAPEASAIPTWSCMAHREETRTAIAWSDTTRSSDSGTTALYSSPQLQTARLREIARFKSEMPYLSQRNLATDSMFSGREAEESPYHCFGMNASYWRSAS